MLVKEQVIFFLRWLQSPRSVGAVFPSSRILARAIASQIDTEKAGAILELGGGTGRLTKAILLSQLASDRLYVIEREQRFCRMLSRRFPDVIILNDNAMRLEKIMEEHHIKTINSIVSGLPLLSLDQEIRDVIVRQTLNLLNDDNKFLQFTYGLQSPVPEYLLKQCGCYGKPVVRVWRNLPPATIWCYRKLPSTEGD